MVNFGNCMRGCAFELLGEVVSPLRDRIGADDEIFVGVERLAGADHEVEPVMIAGDRRHHQDGVGFLGVERAVGDVGDREILDHLAAFQLEVAFAVRSDAAAVAACAPRRAATAAVRRQRRIRCDLFGFPPGLTSAAPRCFWRRDALVPKTLLGSKYSQTARFCTVKGGGSARQGSKDERTLPRGRSIACWVPEISR